MKINFPALFGALALSTCGSSVAFAQQCTPFSGSSQSICGDGASLSGPEGAVSLVRNGGVTSATQATTLAAGDRVVFRAGSGVITIGSTCVSMPANTAMTVTRSSGQVCGRASTNAVAEPTSAQAGPSQPAAPIVQAPIVQAPAVPATIASSSALPYLIGGAVVVGGAGVFAATQRNSKLSP
ncbi:MAG: hypothetical protein JWN93_392 [Hyphomicrobiales bacterium]|nr:hypothetical protein [Hyphomicrobiales bacterium]